MSKYKAESVAVLEATESNGVAVQDAPGIDERPEPLIETIKIDKIVVEPSLQMRFTMNASTVSDYAKLYKEKVEFPPLDVFQFEGKYYLVDGFHRRSGAADAGLKSLPCRVHVGDLRDAFLFAVGANATHGLPRTNQDKRRALMLLMKDPEWKKKSTRVIAMKVGVSHTFVHDWKREQDEAAATGKARPKPRKEPTKAEREAASAENHVPAQVQDEGETAVAEYRETMAEPDAESNGAAVAEEFAERQAIEDQSLSDEEWLERLPGCRQLEGVPLRVFRNDALTYRRFETGRELAKEAFAESVEPAKKSGFYAGAFIRFATRFFQVPHPSRWVACRTPGEGGCGGAGKHDDGHECEKCHGRGYLLFS